jgi:hypothetical protein
MLIGIDNTTGISDVLYGWQLGLEIVPQSGATGSLRFKTAALPDAAYLLDGRSDGLTPAFSGPADTIKIIGDTDSLFSGVSVPPSGKNLLQLDFDALPGSFGLFYIKAVPDLFNGCNWFSGDFLQWRVGDSRQRERRSRTVISRLVALGSLCFSEQAFSIPKNRSAGILPA